jgi:hypothetical protein
MKMDKKISLAAGVMAAMLATTTALAGVPQEQADRLGKDLTPVGGDKAGNKAGTIPEWTGGLTAPPAALNFKKGQHHPNPFASEKPLYTVTAANMDQYKDVLTDGYKALLKTYPTYKMPVYPSHRTCALPEIAYTKTKNNAVVGELEPDGNGVKGSIMGPPFPIPSSGLEFVWNHTLRFRSFKVTRQYAGAIPTSSGDYTLFTAQDEAILHWSDPALTKAEDIADNVSIRYLNNTIAPARNAGNVVLVHEALNLSKNVRQAWVYSPGTRRVRRAPDIAYDNPLNNGDGLATSDMFDMYNGAPDRYNWTVLGRKEILVAYNDYDIGSDKVQYSDIFKPHHINQDLMRYELHRVWVVEGDLKKDARHIYSKRINYIDEDSGNFLSVDLYDGRGELWRVQESQLVNYYDTPLCTLNSDTSYDLQNGRYLAEAFKNQEPTINNQADELQPDRYTPDRIRNLGVR